MRQTLAELDTVIGFLADQAACQEVVGLLHDHEASILINLSACLKDLSEVLEEDEASDAALHSRHEKFAAINCSLSKKTLLAEDVFLVSIHRILHSEGDDDFSCLHFLAVLFNFNLIPF